MAVVPRPKEQYDRLVGMTQPQATPTRRVGTEAPIGAVTGGPAAGKSPAEFTKTAQGSPGSVFSRQLEGADISGITRLAEQPLLREAGQEALKITGEAQTYKKGREEALKAEPQFANVSEAIQKIGAGDEGATGTGQAILNRTQIPVPKADLSDVKEFTPLQAVRGGSVEGLLRREAQGPYTTGMAGLDALLFAKKGGAAELGARGQATRALLQGATNVLEGAPAVGLQGPALEKLQQLGLNIPITSLTGEAEQQAQDFVTKQKENLLGGLTGTLDPMLAGYKANLDPLTSGRAAAVAQQNQAILDYYRNLGGGVRTEVLSTLPTGNPIVTGMLSEGPDIPTVLQNIRNVDIESVVRPYLNLPTAVQPTLADVAAQNPEQAAQYQRLMNMLSTGGRDVSGYGLGATTTQEQASVTADEETIKNAIKTALLEAGSKAPRVRY